MHQQSLPKLSPEPCSQLLESLQRNPQFSCILQKIHIQEEELKVLQFVQRQQKIMKQELVLDKIPYVESNIAKLENSMRDKKNAIQDIRIRIQQVKDKILDKKNRIQVLCVKKRSLVQICKKMDREIGKKNILENVLNCEQQLQQGISGQEEDNKENMDNINKQRKPQKNMLNSSQVQIYDLVDIRTKNIMLESSISKLKESVQSKMVALKKVKENSQQNCRKQQNCQLKKKDKGKGNERNSCGGSLVKSQYVSVEESSVSGLKL